MLKKDTFSYISLDHVTQGFYTVSLESVGLLSIGPNFFANQISPLRIRPNHTAHMVHVSNTYVSHSSLLARHATHNIICNCYIVTYSHNQEAKQIGDTLKNNKSFFVIPKLGSETKFLSVPSTRQSV